MQNPGASASKDATPDLTPSVSQPSCSYTIPQPRKTLRSKTANSGLLATSKTKEKLLANPLYLTKVSTRQLVQKCLAENSLLPPNQDPSLPDLVMVVLNLAYTIPNLGAKALCIVVILINTHPEPNHPSATTTRPMHSPASTQTNTPMATNADIVLLKSHMHLTQYVDQVCIICGSVKVTLCPLTSSVDGVCTCTTPSTHISVDLVIIL